MRRLAFITERYAPEIGGLARSAHRLSHVIAGMDVAVDVIAFSRSLPAGQLLQEEKTDDRLSLYRLGRYKSWDGTMQSAMGVLEWLHQQEPFDAVWGHYLVPSGFLATWFGALFGVKSVVSARGNDIDRDIFPPHDFARLQWTLERASLITAVSQDLQRKISALSKRNDVIVLKNSVDAEKFSQGAAIASLKQSLGIKPDEIVLGFSGELREKKGLQFLLRALTQVKAQRPACLLVIGDVRAQQRAALQIYASEYSSDAERVIFTGHLTDPSLVADHLRLVDVFLQPSLFEGLPNSLLEAMACGLLCLASDAGGIPEVIEHGVNGLILPRAQLHNLGVAILETFDLGKEASSAIKSAARATVKSLHNQEIERDVLTKLLASCF